MNEFYDIALENQKPKDEFQLHNLGHQTIMAVVGKSVRGDWGRRGYESKRYYRNTTVEDYDGLFVSKLLGYKPAYDLNRILDYHINYYTKKAKGDKETFLKHIKYLILPAVRKRGNSEVTVELIETWLKHMTSKKRKSPPSIKVGDINAPTQFLVNSDNSIQHQNIEYNSADIKELLDRLKLDIETLESDLRKEFEDEIEKTLKQLTKDKNIKGRLLTIGGLIKDVGIGVFSNLISSPTFELLKPMLGLS